MDIGQRAATLRDVARLAGVHPATASRVLNGTRSVNPSLARQVRKAAEELNYRVNPVGRALKQRTTGVIGMVVPDLTNPFFPALVRAVERALAAESRALFLCDCNNDPDVERERAEILINRQVDGLIISPVDPTSSRPALEAAAARVPVVQVDRMVENAAIDAVTGDQDQMMSALIEHMQERGARTFALITASKEISPITKRVASYRNLVPDSASRGRILRGDLTMDWGAIASEQLLAEGDPLPDALICANDLIAVGAIGTLQSRGISIPGDMRIGGFDNTPLATAVRPQLTTVQQPIDQIGQEALGMLTHRSADLTAATRRLTLAGTLITRASS